jgi:hypothetical protein
LSFALVRLFPGTNVLVFLWRPHVPFPSKTFQFSLRIIFQIKQWHTEMVSFMPSSNRMTKFTNFSTMGYIADIWMNSVHRYRDISGFNSFLNEPPLQDAGFVR